MTCRASMNNLEDQLSNIVGTITGITFILSFALHQVGCYRPGAGLSFLKKAENSNSLSFQLRTPIRELSFTLDPLTERSIGRFGHIVKKYSGKYHLDWRLVMAVMRQESGFRPQAVSGKGAFGLMQIMPVTQVEVAGKLGLEEAQSPYNNIKAGTYYLRSLYRLFDGAPEEDRLRLTLAAYNAGIGRILDARTVAAYLGDDPNSWRAVMDALPLLSKRYYTLHRSIWEDGKPKSGVFRGFRQTLEYVENVMHYYDEYRRSLS
jgi:soluble lytic murein transglycosylase-like protein